MRITNGGHDGCDVESDSAALESRIVHTNAGAFLYPAAAFYGTIAILSLVLAVTSDSPLSAVGRVVFALLSACFGALAVLMLRWTVRSLDLTDSSLVLTHYLGRHEIEWDRLRFAYRTIARDKARLVLYGRTGRLPLAILTDKADRILALAARLGEHAAEQEA